MKIEKSGLPTSATAVSVQTGLGFVDAFGNVIHMFKYLLYYDQSDRDNLLLMCFDLAADWDPVRS